PPRLLTGHHCQYGGLLRGGCPDAHEATLDDDCKRWWHCRRGRHAASTVYGHFPASPGPLRAGVACADSRRCRAEDDYIAGGISGSTGTWAVGGGAAADIVVFDPDHVADHSTWKNPTLPASGISDVIVNGVPVLRSGTMTGRGPGQYLQRGGAVQALAAPRS